MRAARLTLLPNFLSYKRRNGLIPHVIDARIVPAPKQLTRSIEKPARFLKKIKFAVPTMQGDSLTGSDHCFSESGLCEHSHHSMRHEQPGIHFPLRGQDNDGHA